MKELDFLISRVKNAKNERVLKTATRLAQVYKNRFESLQGDKYQTAQRKYQRLMQLIALKYKKLDASA